MLINSSLYQNQTRKSKPAWNFAKPTNLQSKSLLGTLVLSHGIVAGEYFFKSVLSVSECLHNLAMEIIIMVTSLYVGQAAPALGTSVLLGTCIRCMLVLEKLEKKKNYNRKYSRVVVIQDESYLRCALRCGFQPVIVLSRCCWLHQSSLRKLVSCSLIMDCLHCLAVPKERKSPMIHEAEKALSTHLM